MKQLICYTQKKFFFLIFIAVLTFTSFFLYGKKADAAVQNPFKNEPDVVRDTITDKYGGFFNLDYLYFFTPDYPVKVKLTATSSNKKVMKIFTKEYEGTDKNNKKYYYAGYGFDYKKMRSGNTTIKLTAKIGNKVFKKTIKYHLEKYKNPCIKFKLGNTDYKKQFDKQYFCPITDSAKRTGKISVKLKKGYKIQSIDYLENLKIKKIKNNQKIKGIAYTITVYYINTKTKTTGSLVIGVPG